FLLTVIAALQIYDANYKITGKYKELAYLDNRKLSLLLKSREDFEQFQALTLDRVLHPTEMTPAKQSRLDHLVVDISDHLARYRSLAGTGQEVDAFNKFQPAWQHTETTAREFTALRTSGKAAITFYYNVEQESYEDLQDAAASLSTVLASDNSV